MKEEEASAGKRVRDILSITVLCILMAGAALLARWNSKLKRSDSRGAMRLGGFVLAVYTLQYLVVMYHAPNSHEFGLIADAVSEALFNAALVWVLYLAVEPFVRRRWPQTIVSWSRILGGKLRDPLVGGDILIGVAFGLFWSLLIAGSSLYDQAHGGAPTPWGMDALSGARFLVGGFLGQLAGSIQSAFGTFLLMFLLRLALRKDWLAAAAFVAIFVPVQVLGGAGFWNIPVATVVYGVFALLILRYGIVPLIVAGLTADCLLNAPLTLDFSAWYIAGSLASLLAFLAIAAYGFRCTVAGKKLFELE
jgi:serine/threonine-protein kinase